MRSVLTFFTQILVVAACINLATPVLAQRKGPATAASKAGAAPKCSGAWTGTVTYTRTQANSDQKKVERVSGRGYDSRNWEMKYEYNARVVVTDVPGKGPVASINHNLTSTETVDAVELNSCDRGKTWKEMRGTSKSKTKTTGSEKADANVNIGVNEDGTYTVSVGLPQIKGETTGSQSSEFSGQCTQKEGKSLTLPPTQTSIDGNSLTSSGAHRIDPADPNHIAGSFENTWQNVTETIEWNLQKCGAPLRLTDLKFEDMKWPDWDAWKSIQEQTGTVDGNLVKVKATVLNTSGETKYAEIKFKETYKGDKWDGAKPDAPLDDTVISVRVDPGEEKEVEMVWDSSGYAWFDDGRPRLVQRIKAELEENSKKVGELTKNLKVAPKPLILVHGLWSSAAAWSPWQNILTTAHSYDWKAFAVGEKPEKGIMNTGGSFLSTTPTNSIFENSQQLGKYIRYVQQDRNAWHVDVVAHSMGGLITRHYIHQFMPANAPDGRPQIAHLVMLGTPNMGSPCADVMNTAFEALGKNVEAVRQLRQDVAEEFNRVNVNRKGVRFSVLAGDPLPTMCKSVVWNDGVVPVQSAIWKIKDNAKSKSLHTDLTGTSDFSAFVKPRLAIGPKGNHNPEVGDVIGAATADLSGAMRDDVLSWNNARGYGKTFRPSFGIAGQPSDPPFAKSITVAPKQILDVDIPVAAASNFGLTFMAPSDVSATLFNDADALIGKNLAKTAEATQWFRSIFFDKPTSASTWKLRLENTSDREAEVVLTTWANPAR
ncbi:MAG TPA: alpha/beta hydrolase [Pyrinomonadaceae bacterium]|nr:alpha/beta hydrolase [Pyrinomonadaceae bacterium]